MNPEACCSSSCCYSSLQRTVLNYSRPSLAIRILSKLLPSFFCHNDGFFRKPTSPPLPLREGPPLSPSPFPLRGQGMCQPPYSVLKPLRYKVGGPSEVFASSRAAFCGMQPHGQRRTKWLQKAQKPIAARLYGQEAHSSTPLWTRSPQQHALKGQKLLAQGNALGFNDIQANAL